MYPFLHSVEYRLGPQQLVRLNKFGVHGLNFRTKNYASYKRIADLHVEHQFYCPVQEEDARKRLDAAIYKQYHKEHQDAIVEVWTIAPFAHRPTKPLELVVDGQRFATISQFQPGRHEVFYKKLRPGYYFVKPLHDPAEFFPFAPSGGLRPFQDLLSERYFAPGKCIRLSVVLNDDAKTDLYVTTGDNSSTPECPLVI